MVEQITPEGFAAWTQAAGAQGTAPLLLDVREPAEWRAASVAPQGCKLLQMPMHTVPARLTELDRDRPHVGDAIGVVAKEPLERANGAFASYFALG